MQVSSRLCWLSTASLLFLPGSPAAAAPAGTQVQQAQPPHPMARDAVAVVSSFADSCTDIAYFGYCRVEANCTIDGSIVTDDKTLQHTILDLGQCIGYNSNTEQLVWQDKTIPHWQTSYCKPCSKCTIDPKTTQMICTCRYPNASKNHATALTLLDHVSNDNGVLNCLNANGAPDPNDSKSTAIVAED